MNAEEQCHIFDITSNNEPASITHDENIQTSIDNNETQTPMQPPIVNVGPKIIEKPTLTLTVPVNCNRILIADIGMINFLHNSYNLERSYIFTYTSDGDGFNEVILARTDRVLHVLSFQMGSKDKQTANSITPNLEEKKKWYFDEQVK